MHTAALEKEKERKDGQQNEDMRNIEKQQKSVERYLKKRQQLSERKDECNKNIRDLGVLPEEAFVETTASMEKVRLFAFIALVSSLTETRSYSNDFIELTKR